MFRRTLRLATVTVIAAAAVILPSAPALAAPVFKLPFPCGEVWDGWTRGNHSPVNGIDFNRTNDENDYIVASAPGTVELVQDNGTASYGKHVRINHTGGYTTVYAHLSTWFVGVHQVVGYGTVIGLVGSTGMSTGAHLHYEQRLNGAAFQVKFDGVTALYNGHKNYTSSNGCAGAGTGAGYVSTSSGAAQNVYSSPTLISTLVGNVANNSYQTIVCQVAGQTVTGRWGTSNIWNRIGPGRHIPDVNTDTGYTGFIPGVNRC